LQAIAQGAQHGAQNMPGRVTVGVQILDNLVEPDMRGLQRLIENFEPVGAYGVTSTVGVRAYEGNAFVAGEVPHD